MQFLAARAIPDIEKCDFDRRADPGQCLIHVIQKCHILVAWRGILAGIAFADVVKFVSQPYMKIVDFRISRNILDHGFCEAVYGIRIE